MGKRIDHIDLLKGIGIIFIVWAHTANPFIPFIFTFHVPLFFFISGYFYEEKPFGKFFTDKIRQLLVPYVFFFFLTYLGIALLYGVSDSFETFHSDSFYEIMNGEENFTYNVALWFLLALFLTTFFYFTLHKLKNNYWINSFILVFSLLGYVLSKLNINLPFYLDSIFTSLLFFHAGFLFKENQSFIYSINENISLISSLSLFILLSIYIYTLGLAEVGLPLDLRENHISLNYFVFIAMAFSGIIFWWFFSRKIVRLPFVNFWGRNSLIIMCVHIPLFMLTGFLLLKLKINSINYLYGLLLTIITLLVSSFIIVIVNRYLPFLIGKSRYKPIK